MVVAGVVFAFTSWVPLLIIAGAIGVVSPTGNEVGPFLAIEQAALTQTVPNTRRTATFAWYNVAGYVATATGALGAGLVSQALINGGLCAARRLPGDRHRLRVDRDPDDRRLLAARDVPSRRRRRRPPPTASGAASVSTARSGSSSSCRSCSRSTPSVAASSRRA